jgi:hypothetical protein
MPPEMAMFEVSPVPAQPILGSGLFGEYGTDCSMPTELPPGRAANRAAFGWQRFHTNEPTVLVCYGAGAVLVFVGLLSLVI